MNKFTVLIALGIVLFSFTSCGARQSAEGTAQSPSDTPTATSNTAQHVSPSPSVIPLNGVWLTNDWTPGDGDPAQLKAAVQTVKDSRLSFKEYADPMSGRSIAAEIAAEALKTILRDYNVCIYSIAVGNPFYWDAYDEDGKFYDGIGFDITITLKAGNDSAEVEKHASFGV